jgi:hypothetical protein
MVVSPVDRSCAISLWLRPFKRSSPIWHSAGDRAQRGKLAVDREGHSVPRGGTRHFAWAGFLGLQNRGCQSGLLKCSNSWVHQLYGDIAYIAVEPMRDQVNGGIGSKAEQGAS